MGKGVIRYIGCNVGCGECSRTSCELRVVALVQKNGHANIAQQSAAVTLGEGENDDCMERTTDERVH